MSYFKQLQQGSRAGVFSTRQHCILWKGADPTLSHPAVMSQNHGELSGLTSVLLILPWVCSMQGVDTGSVHLFCDNESALNHVFSTARALNNPLKQLFPDVDLITCARDLLLQLPVGIYITKEWVKGHYTGNNRAI